MISIKDLVDTCRAIELLSYGIDISKLDDLKQYWNIKDKKLQSKVSPNIVHKAIINLGEDVTEFLTWPIGTYFLRDNNEWFTVFEDALSEDEKQLKVINVDLSTFKEVMKVLKSKSLVSYVDIDINEYYPEYYKEITKERAKFNFKDLTDCQMVDELSLDKNRNNLIAMLMCSSYEKEIGEAVLKAYDNPTKDFEIPALKDYEVIDNRIYIKVPAADREVFKNMTNNTSSVIDNIKYIVISRNPYDFFFCSYGSNIQSCYSINSTNFGWYGAVANSACKGTYIIYGADNKCNKINIINGKKWNVPHMYFRSWGWLAEDGRLLVDRIYPDGTWSLNDRNDLLELLSPYLGYDCSQLKKNHIINLKYGKELKEWYVKHRCHMYPDSTRFASGDVVRYDGVCYGDRGFIGNCPLRKSLLDIMHEVSEIAEGIIYDKDYQIVNGVLTNTKRCPITKLPILPTESVSVYAKHFKEPVEGDILIGTYCDGFFKGDVTTCIRSSSSCNNKIITVMDNTCGSSNRDGDKYYFYNLFSTKRIPIKVFKEQITGAVKSSPFEYVLIRYILDDKVTFVKYKGSKE